MSVAAASNMNTSYLHRVFRQEDFNATVRCMIKKVSQIHEETPFEALAFTGQSGAAIAYVLGYTLALPLILVRRDDDESHHVKVRGMQQKAGFRTGPRYLEGHVDSSSFLIVDDQIETGASIDLITNRIKEYNPYATCVGVVLYSWNYSRKLQNPNAPRQFRDDDDTFPVYFGGVECMSQRK